MNPINTEYVKELLFTQSIMTLQNTFNALPHLQCVTVL